VTAAVLAGLWSSVFGAATLRAFSAAIRRGISAAGTGGLNK
jgi:hypothetical protein